MIRFYSKRIAFHPRNTQSRLPVGRRLCVSKKSAYGVLFRVILQRFPLGPLGLPGGKRCKETLLRKACESAAHAAGFALHLEGCGPPNHLKGFLTVCAASQPGGGFVLFKRTNAQNCCSHRRHSPLSVRISMQLFTHALTLSPVSCMLRFSTRSTSTVFCPRSHCFLSGSKRVR